MWHIQCFNSILLLRNYSLTSNSSSRRVVEADFSSPSDFVLAVPDHRIWSLVGKQEL